jgi:predicted TPR repeat methyltransferase
MEPCPACSHANSRIPFPDHPALAGCPSCGLLFRTDRFQIHDPNAAYHRDAEISRPHDLIGEEEFRQPYYETQAARISGWFDNLGSLLEIGAGTGGLLKSLEAKGWDAEGIEPSETLLAFARSRLGEKVLLHHCLLGQAEELLSLRPYRAIVALDVIEHLPDIDLLPAKAFDWLVPDGLLFLQTPNSQSLRRRLEGGRWEQIAPEEHFAIHSARSLRLLLERTGFKVESLETMSGGATDTPARRAIMNPVGRLLNLFGIGNALWAVARKRTF